MKHDELARLRALLATMKTGEIMSQSPVTLSSDRFRIHAPAITAAFQRATTVLSQEGLTCTAFVSVEEEPPKIGIWITEQMAVYVYPDGSRAAHALLSLFLSDETSPRVTMPLAYQVLTTNQLDQSIYALIARVLRILQARTFRLTTSHRGRTHQDEQSA